MIQNERQYGITRAQVANLNAVLKQSRESGQKLSPELRDAVIAGIRSQIEDLRAELREYENLKAGRTGFLHLESLTRLGEILIKARIARGYTQAELAGRLDLKPQQIQKYEATYYESASLHRLLDVMYALEIDVRAEVDLRSEHKPEVSRKKEGERPIVTATS